MHAAQAAAGIADDARPRTTYLITLTAIAVTLPFTVVHFMEWRVGLAACSLAVVLVLAFNAWAARTRRYGPGIVLATVVPPLALFLVVSVFHQGVIGLLWCFPSLVGLYCMLPPRMAWTANAALLLAVVPAVGVALEPGVALRGVAALLCVSLFAAIQLHIIDRQRRQLSERVVTDPLTGLLNRHALVPTLERIVERAERDRTSEALMLVDVDHFKRINDEHGHEAGDAVLEGLGSLLRCRMRAGDAAFRIGGDEFLLVLRGAGETEVARLAGEIGGAIRSAGLLPDRAVTVSVGHAALRPGDDRLEWVRRADSALYRAKGAGRDRAVGELRAAA